MDIHPSRFFGTDGIRTRVGSFPLTLEALPHLGYAIACWATWHCQRTPNILIVRDTRESCHFIQAGLSSGLLLSNITLYDGGILPTPAAHVALQSGRYDIALIITASHNEYHDNGIKILSARTNKISTEDQKMIVDILTSTQAPCYTQMGSITQDQHAADFYKQKVLSLFPPLFLAGTRIVLDCAHGATSVLAHEMFAHCGAEVVTINSTPDGKNINANCGAVHPEQLAKTVVASKADAGFAFDGDGDRVIAVSKDGEIKNGDDILYLLSFHQQYADCTTFVGSIMANQGLERTLQTQGKQLVRTPVGDKHIANALVEHDLLLGAEPSGHVIAKDYLLSSDGIFTALRLMQACRASGNSAMKTFSKMPHIVLNLPVNHKKDLTSPELASIINQYTGQLTAGRLLVRYSGTENLLRIMVEDTVYDHAYSIAHDLGMKLSTLLT